MAEMARTVNAVEERSVSRSFEGFAGWCAIVSGLLILLYSISTIAMTTTPRLSAVLSAALLVLIGLLNSAVVVAVCIRLQEADAVFALWVLLLGTGGALGVLVRGGHNLASALNPPTSPSVDLASAIDPNGLLTFGLTGVVTFVIGWLIQRGGQFSYGLGYLGYALGALLVITYVGRLISSGSTSPVVLGSALLTGFILSPVWHVWLGIGLLRGPRL